MLKKRITFLIAFLGLASSIVQADSGHLHSAIPVLQRLIKEPGNTTMLGELRFLSGAIESTPDNRQVKAALMAVLACGRLQAGLQEEGLAVCRQVQKELGDTEFARLIDPSRLEEPGKAGRISTQQVERQYKQVLDNALALVVKLVNQGKVDKVQARTMIAKSAFRKTGEKEPEPGPFVPAALAEQNRESPQSYPLLDRSKVNLFDGLVYLRKRRDLDLSVDPDILPYLASLKAELPKLLAIEDFAALETLLSSHSLLLAKAEVAPNQRAAFVTMPSSWAYSSACRLLRENDLAGAYRILNQAGTDTSAFAAHAAKLKEILVSTATNRKALQTLERDVRDALNTYRRAKTASETTRPSFGLERSDGTAPTVPSSAAKQSFERAVKQVNEIKLEFENNLRNILESNLPVVERFNETFEQRLYAEAAYILEYLIEVQRTVSEIAQMFRQDKFKLTVSWPEKNEVPEEIQAARSTLNEIGKMAAARVSAGQSLIGSNPARAGEQFNAACCEDPVNPQARIGAGYCAMLRHKSALTDVFDRSWADDELAMKLARENRARRKDGFIRALNFVTYGNTPLPTATPEEGKQGAVGSALAALPGSILPLTVRLEPRRGTARRYSTAPKDPYWKNLRLARLDETSLNAEGITFGDQNKKDPRLLAAAQDVQKWLKWTHEKAMRNRGLHVEFTNPDGSSLDHSLGLPAALGGFSCITNTPLRQDMTSAGNLQPDGSLNKIEGAHSRAAVTVRAEGAELLLLPRSVEAELLLVPIDCLCLVIIVTADQIGSLQNYAVDPNYRREALDSLREAQALLLLGQDESARPILRNVASRHPEIYTARRLLELIALYRPD